MRTHGHILVVKYVLNLRKPVSLLPYIFEKNETHFHNVYEALYQTKIRGPLVKDSSPKDGLLGHMVKSIQSWKIFSTSTVVEDN